MSKSNKDIRFLNSMYERLRAAQYNKMPQKLAQAIKARSLKEIISYILSNKDLKEKVKNLPPSSGVRFSKAQTKLNRTFSISRTPEGEYLCILETQSKNAEDKKVKTKIYSGASKSGKVAWRLDQAKHFQSYLSLKVNLSKEQKSLRRINQTIQAKINRFKKEMLLPWNIPKNPWLHHTSIGEIYNSKSGLNLKLYSRKGMPLTEAMNILSDAQKDEVTMQLLEGLNFMHKQGYIHQDIKPRNILVFFKNDGLQVKYIDFGGTTREKANSKLLGTIGYESPEMASASTLKNFPYRNHYAKHYKKRGLTWARRLAIQANDSLAKRESYIKPHRANDVWSLGITLYMMYCDGKPKAQPKSPLLSKMLEPNRSKRATAEQALKIWQDMLNEKNAGHDTSYIDYLLWPAKSITNQFCSFVSDASKAFQNWYNPPPPPVRKGRIKYS